MSEQYCYNFLEKSEGLQGMDKKSERMIELHSRLMSGRTINKKTEAIRYRVSEKTIQRDIEDLRVFFFKHAGYEDEHLKYDKDKNGYHLSHNYEHDLRKEEIFLTCMILISSRIMDQETLNHVIENLVVRNSLRGEYESSDFLKILKQHLKNYQEAETNNRIAEWVWLVANAICEEKSLHITTSDNRDIEAKPTDMYVNGWDIVFTTEANEEFSFQKLEGIIIEGGNNL